MRAASLIYIEVENKNVVKIEKKENGMSAKTLGNFFRRTSGKNYGNAGSVKKR